MTDVVLFHHALDAELFLHPGDRHLFGDSALPSHHPDAGAPLRQRSLDFLARVGA